MRKEIDPQGQVTIEQITENKTTYEVPRVRAILKIDQPKYMVHMHLKRNNLLIKRSRTRGSSRPYIGKIEVVTPNTR